MSRHHSLTSPGTEITTTRLTVEPVCSDQAPSLSTFNWLFGGGGEGTASDILLIDPLPIPTKMSRPRPIGTLLTDRSVYKANLDP